MHKKRYQPLKKYFLFENDCQNWYFHDFKAKKMLHVTVFLPYPYAPSSAPDTPVQCTAGRGDSNDTVWGLSFGFWNNISLVQRIKLQCYSTCPIAVFCKFSIQCGDDQYTFLFCFKWEHHLLKWVNVFDFRKWLKRPKN